jgi:hypothetical protein
MESKQTNEGYTWVWGGVLIALGGLFLLNRLFDFHTGLLIPAVILGGVGLTFFTVYASNHERWWALIPAYLMWALAAAFTVGSIFPELLGMLLPMALGIPFLYVYQRNNEHWWALIPAYTMFSAGIIVFVGIVFGGRSVASIIMFLLALPFFYVYLRHNDYWWALIPAGIFASIGLALMLVGFIRFVPVLMIIIGIYLLVRRAGGGQSNGQSIESSQPPAV